VTPARPKTTFGIAVLWLCAGAAAMSLLAACGSARAQPPAAAAYQVYALRHKSAADVEKVLSEMLAGMGDSTHIVADVKANQILLRGPEKAQQAARQLIQSMDRPPAGPAAEAKPLVKSYRCAEGRQAEVLARLRSAYAQRSDVRAAIDPQTGALLVLGPPAVHAEILPWIPAPAELSVPRQLNPAPDAGPSEQFLVLTNTRVGDVEITLQELFRERLIPLFERRLGYVEYRYAGARGQHVDLGFDRQRNGVTILGSGPAAAQWLRLIRSLDVPPQSEDQATEVVPLYYANPLKVQEAVEAYRRGAGGTEPRSGGPRGRRLSPQGNPQGRVFDHGLVEQVSYLFQARGEGAGGQPAADGAAPPNAGPPKAGPPAPGEKPPAAPEEDRLRRLREMGLDVEIETLPDLDAIIIRGRKRDVEEIKRIIQEIERLSAETEPVIEVYFLRQVQGEALSTIIRQVQADVLAGRQGPSSRWASPMPCC